MSLTSRTFSLLLFPALVCGLSAAAPDGVTLVADGKGRAAIIVAAGAEAKSGPVVGASVLCEHLAQMSGARLAVVREGDAGKAEVKDGVLRFTGGKVPGDATAFVLIGEGEATRRLGVTAEGLGGGGLYLKTTANAVVLLGATTGPDTRGCRYAVVALLEELGCRYLWPGETGKVVPRMATITVGPLDRKYTPPVGQRHIRMMPGGPRFFDKGLAFLDVKEEEWKACRNEALKSEASISWYDWHGMNGYALGILGGHNGAGLGAGGREALKAHPEWGALQADGTRDQSGTDRFRLCVSNPELVAHVAELAIQRVKEAPGTVSYALSPNDGGTSSFCMCEACKKLDPPEAPKLMLPIFAKVGEGKRTEIEYPSLSDRYVHYWNAVAERVVKVHPNLLLIVDAYSFYATPPVREKLHPNLVVRYVPSDPAGWEGWKAAGAKRIFWRPNNLHSGYREAVINYCSSARPIADTMSQLAAGGMIAVDIQGIYENWATQGMSYYAAARTMWNPKLTYDEVLSDYCRAGFGAAAEPVRQYFLKAEAMGRTFEKTTRPAMAELKAQLDAADKAAGADEAVRKRIAFLRAGLDYSTVTAQAGQMRLALEQKQPVDKELAARLLDRRWLMMREMLKKNVLAVNVGLVAGYDDTSWRDLGWRAPTTAAKAGAGSAAPKPDDGWLYEDQSQTGKKVAP
jgi:hypothetical protein